MDCKQFDAYRNASKLHATALSARIPMARKIKLLAKLLQTTVA